MKKQPLNSLGVQQVLLALYSLPENELQHESQQALEDLPRWLLRHFDLRSHQLQYLGTIPADYISILAENISHFLSLRQPIQLVVPYSDELPPIDHPGKLLITGESTTATYVPNQGYTLSKSLQITFVLPPSAH
ncbi:hypothetical protein [Parapedobacter koreensis]|uniref:Uncharacterized protein n=1 Tax=Parapedobacter koreensis TaxID=332977 RepID=A0A1H7TWI1_9SPHI|nr:hypothetical protein [Parapedobacter koreensis]SEL88925.1 hypothetical protein SAMN05421740_112123 [Parapedobacter koreensis]